MAERSRTVLVLLIALVLLAPLGGAALYIAVFSMADCPQYVHQEPRQAWGKYRCFRCKDSGRITILNRWIDGKESTLEWEGMEISTVSTVGAQKIPVQQTLEVAGLRPGLKMTQRLQHSAIRALWATESYDSVDLRVRNDATKPGKVVVTLNVTER